MKCVICALLAASTGVLCAECLSELPRSSAEAHRVWSTQTRLQQTALIDPWGRIVRVDTTTRIGRHFEAGVTLDLEGVAYAHAELTFDGEAWVLRDLGSGAETLVDGTPLECERVLWGGELLQFGGFGMYFVDQIDWIGLAMLKTAGPARAPRERRPRGTGAPDRELSPDQIPGPQLELLDIFVRALVDQQDRDPRTRGFVPVAELLERLSLPVAPRDVHVRQLVHRLRQTLARTNLTYSIEAQQELGFRLQLNPINQGTIPES